MSEPEKNVPAPRDEKYSEETINRLVATQAKEHELKARELDIRQQELSAQSQFAHKMLDAQVGDRESERTHIVCLQRNRFVAVGLLLLLIVGFLCYGLYLNHAELVFEFAKLLTSALVGAFGGYGYKAQKDKQKKDSE